MFKMQGNILKASSVIEKHHLAKKQYFPPSEYDIF